MRPFIIVLALLASVGCAQDAPPTPAQLTPVAGVTQNQHLRERGAAAYNAGRYREALGYLLPAAQQGDVLAQTMVSTMYAQGQGAPRDYAAAARWARSSAEQGEPHGQVMLATLVNEGNGTPRDPVEAYMWATLAVNGGAGTLAAQERDRIGKALTPFQIASAQRMAREWRRR